MTTLAHNLYRIEQVRTLERYAIEQLEISGTVLMERAGAAAFEFVQKRWPEAKSIAVVCGTGNNAGDGYVVARLAKEQGLQVTCLQLGETSRLAGDALAAYQRLVAMDVEATPFNAESCRSADLIVDAILGIGLKGEVDEQRKSAIKAMNACGKPILAIDVPSGLNADNGQPHGIAVKATVTITFIGNKQGFFVADGRDYCGERVFNPLSLPLTLYEQAQSELELIGYRRLKSLLQPRAASAYKGDFGHVLLVGGAPGFTGAIRMAGEAAARAGAGLVSIATRPEHAGSLNATRPELMVHGVVDEKYFHSLAEKVDVIAIGPGLGLSEWSKDMLNYAIDSGLPLVVDADALNLLSAKPQKRHNWILTPHIGEAARLLGQSNLEIKNDRFAAAAAVQEEYGGIVILKGAGSLICSGQMPMMLCSEGNPGMASGGMGDVLTGVIAGLLAQGLNRKDAAAFGVCVHATAGDKAAAASGERGMLASDLMPWVRRLVNP